jgi:dihydroorotase-like cyclic amidohydrolase
MSRLTQRNAAHHIPTMSILIKGGTVVNADVSEVADVLLADGKIAAVGPDLVADEGVEVVDATGQLVMPGGIDPHVHLEIPVGCCCVTCVSSGQLLTCSAVHGHDQH